jgi:hypothetical protein
LAGLDSGAASRARSALNPGDSIMRLLLVLLAFLPSMAAAQTPAERTRLDWVLQRGRLIFALDDAAAVTGDDLRAQRASAGIRGWTVERDGDAMIVNYYARGEGDAFVVAYRGRVERGRVVSREIFPEGARPPLTPIQRRMAAARGAMEGFVYRRCTQPLLNVTVIPPENADAPVELYALAAQTEANVYPFGGHYLLTISADGRIASQRPFSDGCLNTPTRDGGRRPRAVHITHLLDPLPTEIHVFMSAWTRLPLYVTAGEPRRIWEVTGDRIRLAEPRN